MVRTTTRIGYGFAASIGLFALTAYGQSDLKFKLKYELEINLPDESRSVKSRAYIQDGSPIPIEIGKYKAELKVSSTSPGYYEVEISVSEGGNRKDTDSNVARVSFSGEDGVPVWFKWGTAEIDVNLQLVASSDRQ